MRQHAPRKVKGEKAISNSIQTCQMWVMNCCPMVSVLEHVLNPQALVIPSHRCVQVHAGT
jgi:hypothetical protein